MLLGIFFSDVLSVLPLLSSATPAQLFRPFLFFFLLLPPRHLRHPTAPSRAIRTTELPHSDEQRRSAGLPSCRLAERDQRQRKSWRCRRWVSRSAEVSRAEESGRAEAGLGVGDGWVG